MVTVNQNYLKLPGSYLFSNIAKKVKAYKEANPEFKDSVISLGIGDVTQPLAPETSRRSSDWITRLQFATQFILYM